MRRERAAEHRHARRPAITRSGSRTLRTKGVYLPAEVASVKLPAKEGSVPSRKKLDDCARVCDDSVAAAEAAAASGAAPRLADVCRENVTVPFLGDG